MKKLILSIFALAILLGMPSFASAAEGDLVWMKQVNPSSNNEIATEIVVQGGDLYVAGWDSPWTMTRLQKLSSVDGSIIWTRTIDGIGGLSSDSTGLYTLASVAGEYCTQKRSLTNGDVLWTNNCSATIGYFAIFAEDSGVYVVGSKPTPLYSIFTGDYDFYIEKLSPSDGGNIWTRVTNPSTPSSINGPISYDWFSNLHVDNLGVHVVGWTRDGAGNAMGYIETLNPNNGGLRWSKNMSDLEYIGTVSSDNSGLYIAGAGLPSGTKTVIKKLSHENGSEAWSKTEAESASWGGTCSNNSAVDATGFYYTKNLSGASWKGIMEKRDSSGGNLVWRKESIPLNSAYCSLVVDNSGIYTIGYDNNLGAQNSQWRIEKREIIPPAPVAPTNLTATTHATCDTGQVNLTWSGVSGATGYDTRIDGGAWVNRGNVTSYSYPGLAATSVHTFEVRAWNGAGAGAASASVAGTAPALCGAACVADTWTGRTPAVDNNWQSVTYGNGLFVAVSINGTGNRVMTSPDGITWTLRTSAANKNWLSVTYGNGLFVAVSGGGVDTSNRVMTSPDGITWTGRTAASNSYWQSVTYGNGLFVAVACGVGSQASCNANAGNRVMTSPDGITWTIRTTTGNNYWQSVTYGNGLFVAVPIAGGGTGFMTSPDGITWTLRVTPAATNNWTSVTYGNGLFVAVASSGTGNRVMTSPDGITWTSRASAADNNWQSVTYGNGLFVAVSVTGVGSRVMTSPDGITWTLRTSPAGNQWLSVAYGNSLFTAVDPYGNVMTAPCTAAPVPTLKICIGSIYLGKATATGTTLTTRTIPTIGNSETLKAWSGTDNITCDGTDVTATTTWNDESGNTAVDITGTNTPSVTITAKNIGSETISIPSAVASPRINIPYNVPAPSCTSNCNAQKGNYCQGETFTTNNSCGVSETCTNAGTRYCDMNWKEVAPGQ